MNMICQLLTDKNKEWRKRRSTSREKKWKSQNHESWYSWPRRGQLHPITIQGNGDIEEQRSNLWRNLAGGTNAVVKNWGNRWRKMEERVRNTERWEEDCRLKKMRKAQVIEVHWKIMKFGFGWWVLVKLAGGIVTWKSAVLAHLLRKRKQEEVQIFSASPHEEFPQIVAKKTRHKRNGMAITIPVKFSYRLNDQLCIAIDFVNFSFHRLCFFHFLFGLHRNFLVFVMRTMQWTK